MSVREYIGARYVPLFADPIEWDNTKTYEPLTIVYYQGNSYTSRQAVPTGIAITNETYWALTGNYNAQIEAYREEVSNYAEQVAGFDSRIDSVEDNVQAAGSDIDDIEAALPINDFDENNTVSDALDALDTRLDAIEANNWVTNARISNNSVTPNKIKNDMMVFGDSWIADNNYQPVPGCWIYDVQSFLKADHLYCYAKASSGIGNLSPNGNSVYSQAQKAVSELTANEIAAIKYIFIMGGQNDFGTTQPSVSALLDALNTTLAYIRTNFPEATVYVVAPDIFFDFQYICNERARKYNSAYLLACKTNNCVFFTNFTSFFVGFGKSVYRPNDDSSYTTGGGTHHPNNDGNKWIAYFITQRLAGNQVHVPVDITGKNGFVITENRSYTDGEYLYLDFKMTIPDNASNGFINCAEMLWDGYGRCFYLGDRMDGDQIMIANPQWFGNSSYPATFNASLWLDTLNFGNLNCFLASGHPTSGTGMRYIAKHSIVGY